MKAPFDYALATESRRQADRQSCPEVATTDRAPEPADPIDPRIVVDLGIVAEGGDGSTSSSA
jgi:hypothetical protein